MRYPLSWHYSPRLYSLQFPIAIGFSLWTSFPLAMILLPPAIRPHHSVDSMEPDHAISALLALFASSLLAAISNCNWLFIVD